MRDLCVLINTNLTWGTHSRGLINKCNRTMGMIKRAVGFKDSYSFETRMCGTVKCRPTLAYRVHFDSINISD